MVDNQPYTNSQKIFSVLITGGSGLIGRYLTSALLTSGYNVSHLSRGANQFGKVRVFRWNPEKDILDPLVFEGVDYLIHLAGTSIGKKRWSKKRQKEIANSRIDSAKLIFRVINENGIKLKGFISASAIGYYGCVNTDRIFTENDSPAEDFLGATCRKWEEAADLFTRTGTRVVKLRTGVVMEKNDTLLSRFLKVGNRGIFPVLGSGKQFIPWIHIQDLCNIYLKAIKDDRMEGAYNAVSPHHISQIDLVRSLSHILNKPFFHPPVPAIFLKVAFGRMSDLVLKGSRVSSEKIRDAGYDFLYNDLEETLTKVIFG